MEEEKPLLDQTSFTRKSFQQKRSTIVTKEEPGKTVVVFSGVIECHSQLR